MVSDDSALLLMWIPDPLDTFYKQIPVSTH